MEKIAKGLGAARSGKIPASAGYFGALQLAVLLLTRTTGQPSGGEAEKLVDAALSRR